MPPTIPKEPLQSCTATFQGKAIEPCQGSPCMKVHKYVANPHERPQCLAPPKSKMCAPHGSLLMQQLMLFMPADKLLFPCNVGHGSEGPPPLSTYIAPRASPQLQAPKHCPHLVQQCLLWSHRDKMCSRPISLFSTPLPRWHSARLTYSCTNLAASTLDNGQVHTILSRSHSWHNAQYATCHVTGCDVM